MTDDDVCVIIIIIMFIFVNIKCDNARISHETLNYKLLQRRIKQLNATIKEQVNALVHQPLF